MENSPFPLAPGSSGPAIDDLKRRLIAAGFAVEHGNTFGAATEAAVHALQTDRGIDITGVVDDRTWAALVEAGYRLGDRPLYRHSPMLRGADVTALQLKLGTLGFDAGWVDGIFGPDTERAVLDFQRNAALLTDGIAGNATVAVLERFGGRQSDATVVSVRERDVLRNAGPDLVGRRIVVGERGECPALVDAVGRALRRNRAEVLTLHEPDLSEQAHAANAFEGSLYLGIGVRADPSCVAHYFSTEGFTSTGGKALAERVEFYIPRVLRVDQTETVGGRLPILRETRMPALWCELGPTTAVVRRTAALADTIVTMLVDWCRSPFDDDLDQ